MNQMVEWSKEEKKKAGLKCLRILFFSVYGVEMMNVCFDGGRVFRDLWKDEGKDEEGRRE